MSVNRGRYASRVLTLLVILVLDWLFFTLIHAKTISAVTSASLEHFYTHTHSMQRSSLCLAACLLAAASAAPMPLANETVTINGRPVIVRVPPCPSGALRHLIVSFRE